MVPMKCALPGERLGLRVGRPLWDGLWLGVLPGSRLRRALGHPGPLLPSSFHCCIPHTFGCLDIMLQTGYAGIPTWVKVGNAFGY